MRQHSHLNRGISAGRVTRVQLWKVCVFESLTADNTRLLNDYGVCLTGAL